MEKLLLNYLGGLIGISIGLINGDAVTELSGLFGISPLD